MEETELLRMLLLKDDNFGNHFKKVWHRALGVAEQKLIEIYLVLFILSFETLSSWINIEFLVKYVDRVALSCRVNGRRIFIGQIFFFFNCLLFQVPELISS